MSRFGAPLSVLAAAAFLNLEAFVIGVFGSARLEGGVRRKGGAAAGLLALWAVPD